MSLTLSCRTTPCPPARSPGHSPCTIPPDLGLRSGSARPGLSDDPTGDFGTRRLAACSWSLTSVSGWARAQGTGDTGGTIGEPGVRGSGGQRVG